MAGLLAWAADVVGGANQGVAGADDPAAAFTPEQRRYAAELDERAASLRLSIQELRARIPPADIAKSLPHLHAHSVASNAALALQLNSHSTTRQQARIREDTLQEENLAYEKAIQTCQKKIQEKLEEAHLLQSKLKEMDVIQRELEEEMESLRLSCDGEHPITLSDNSKSSRNISDLKEPSIDVLLKQLNEKKKDLASIEELIQNLENIWAHVNQEFINKPTPAQREKILDKQLHSLVEQLTAKHAQAEGFQLDIRNKQLELEKLNALSKRLGSGTPDTSATRNRSMRTGLFSADNGVEGSHRYATGATPIHDGMRTPMHDRAWNPYASMDSAWGNWDDANPATWGRSPQYQPMTPENAGLDAMSPAIGGEGEVYWFAPDLLVNVHRSGEGHHIGVVKEVLMDGACKVAIGSSGSGDVITALSTELEVMPPKKSDKIKILSGSLRGLTGKLIGVDGSDGIVKLDEKLDVKILDMILLGKLTS